MIKRPYLARMAFWPDDPSRTVTVQWQYAKEGAGAIPWPHAFGSSRYDDEERDEPPTWGELEEVPRTRRIPNSDFAGLKPCGDIQTWQHGADDDTPLLAVDDTGIPLCCRPPVGVWGFRIGFQRAELVAELVASVEAAVHEQWGYLGTAALAIGAEADQLGSGLAAELVASVEATVADGWSYLGTAALAIGPEAELLGVQAEAELAVEGTDQGVPVAEAELAVEGTDQGVPVAEAELAVEGTDQGVPVAEAELAVGAENFPVPEEPDMVGEIKWGLWSEVPAGWLELAGQTISRATYAALYAAIGEQCGPGDGTTTFTLPDWRGRSPIGAGTGAGLTERTNGEVYGNEVVAIGEGALPAHTHGLERSEASSSGFGLVASAFFTNRPIVTPIVGETDTTFSRGDGDPVSILHPVACGMVIVKY